MKNSVIPVIALILVALALPFCIDTSASGGSDGPQLSAGLYEGREGVAVPSYDSDTLPVVVALEALQEGLEGLVPVRPLTDRRLGLEMVGWQATALVAEDTHALTRAAIKGLAERLSGALLPGQDLELEPTRPADYRVVTIVPVAGEPVPIPVERVLRVRTRSADLSAGPAGASTAELLVSLHDPRHPSVPLQSAAGIRAGFWRLRMRSPGSDAAGLVWPRWYASIGRHLADSLLDAAGASGSAPCNWQATDFQQRHGDWQDAVPVQPRHELVHWQAAWQQPLVRGRQGVVYGSAGTDRQDRPVPAEDAIAAILERGGWQRIIDEPAQRRWAIERAEGLQHVAIWRRDYGWEVGAWQQLPEAADRLETWRAAATGPDATGARQHLRRHLLAPGLDELQGRGLAEALDPDFSADAAVLGRLPQASSRSQALAQQVDWLRGVTGGSRDQAPPMDGATVARLPVIGALGAGLAALLPVQDRRMDVPLQVWYRTDAQSALQVLPWDGTGTLRLAGHGLRLVDGQVLVE
ncbi:MAG: hypothetical protein ACOCXJ_06710 [Planctomycetota bacterium]